MSPTPIIPTLFNATLNAYEGKRPKVPEKKYDIKDVFDDLKQHKFPVFLRKKENTYVKHIQVRSVSVCTPGGRGCVGRERMGKRYENRQVVTKNEGGLRENPKYNASNKKKYGLIEIKGEIVYNDGVTGKISIPVDSSGVIGLRTGSSHLVLINPANAKGGQNMTNMIEEIEALLFPFLKIKKERPARLEAFNGMYNLYTNKLKTNRPKIKNDFVAFLMAMGKELKPHYMNPRMPWLLRQRGPSVMKGIFKPKEDDKRYPTVSISPYGHVEILGANGFKPMISAYNLLNNAFSALEPKVKEITRINTTMNQPVKRKYTKRVVNVSKYNISALKLENLTHNAKSRFTIQKHVCKTLPKNILVSIATHYGISTKGTKDELCERLSALKK